MRKKRKTVLEMNKKELRKYLLKPSSYCNFNLPKYFNIEGVLKRADEIMKKHNENFKSMGIKKNKMVDINYNLVMNKDGLYDWRPLSLIHPLAYVDLVNLIVMKWDKIKERFKGFQSNPKIKCISLPIESTTDNSDKAETILNWWENLEQSSIAYSLDYMYCIKTDITNCYGSIYTHSISWALYGKEYSKKNRNNGTRTIDSCIMSLQNGQTNGIPQGSVVFDIIAEIILGYSDELLSEMISNNSNISNEDDFMIIRYRDDYRIFSNKKEVAEEILRNLSDILADLNMHFNSKKTRLMDDIIIDSVKKDKLDWMITESSLKTLPVINNLSLQKHLLQIYMLQKEYPNSGSVVKALNTFLDRIQCTKKLPDDYRPILGILINIIVSAPKTVPIGMAIMSNILRLLEDNDEEIVIILEKIMERIKNMPNSGFIEIWLQRLSITVDEEYKYEDVLCKKVYSDSKIWNTEWLDVAFDEDIIIDKKYIKEMSMKISKQDVDEFYIYRQQ